MREARACGQRGIAAVGAGYLDASEPLLEGTWERCPYTLVQRLADGLEKREEGSGSEDAMDCEILHVRLLSKQLRHLFWRRLQYLEELRSNPTRLSGRRTAFQAAVVALLAADYGFNGKQRGRRVDQCHHEHDWPQQAPPMQGPWIAWRWR
jgi:hypothetical protein